MRIINYDKLPKMKKDTFFITDNEEDGTKKVPAQTLLTDLMLLNPSPVYDLFTQPEQKKMVYRGNDLGDVFTKEQIEQIDSGEYTDLFAGDYWTIDNIVWRIQDFDYWMNTGDKNIYGRHHLVIMPDSCLYDFKMNDTDTTEGGYVWSKMRQEGLEQAKEMIFHAFGEEHILNHKEYLCNASIDGLPAGVSWYDSIVDLPNEIMLYGSYIMTPQNMEIMPAQRGTIDKNRLGTMEIHQQFITSARESFWIRDTVTGTDFACFDRQGFASHAKASKELGVRPVFGLHAG